MSGLALGSGILEIIQIGCLAVELWAFIDCTTRPADAFRAAEKLTKPGWLVITGLAAVVTFFAGTIGFFGIAAIIAALVYLADVRPAVREISGGSR
ncbi:MAG: DUF2516 family protein [Mycobacteriales bacterium]